MTVYLKNGGIWKKAIPYAKNTTWKKAQAAYVKVSGAWRSFFLDSGVVDYGFTPNDLTGMPFNPSRVFYQSDGKVLVSGSFESMNGLPVNYICRFLTNGKIDTSFFANTGAGGTGGSAQLHAVASNNKFVLAGAGTLFNGQTWGRLGVFSADGVLDTAFQTNMGTGFNSTPLASGFAPDGSVITGGSFTLFNGLTRNYLIKLSASGVEDSAFYANLGTGFSTSVSVVRVQPDGKILVGGNFTTLNGVAVGRIARLNADGTPDTAFNTNITGTGLNVAPSYIQLQSDGKIVLCGNFTLFNGVTVGRVTRLNADGTRDTSFANTLSYFGATVTCVAITSTGKIMTVGSYVNNAVIASRGIARLNADGTADTTFNAVLGSGVESSLVWCDMDATDTTAITGPAYYLNGTQYFNRLAEINNDGTLNTTTPMQSTQTGFSGNALMCGIQPDGKIVVSSGSIAYAGVRIYSLCRLELDGTLDSAFAANIGTGPNVAQAATTRALALTSTGKIAFGGGNGFATWNGAAYKNFVMLNADGTVDTAFMANVGTGPSGVINSIVIQPDGKFLLGGSIATWNGVSVAANLVRLNTDGTRDTTFSTNLGTGFSAPILTITIQPSGGIVVGGGFTTVNGRSCQRIARLNTNGTPDTTYEPQLAGGTVAVVASDSAGRVTVLGTSLTTVGGVTVLSQIFRLTSAGALDTAFMANIGTGPNLGPGWSNTATAAGIYIYGDDRILLSGWFFLWNGSTCRGLVMLDSAGIRDTTYPTTAPNSGSAHFLTDFRSDGNGKLVAVGTLGDYNLTQASGITRIGE